MSRIYISATHKSSGKTTLSIGLCRALTRKELMVQPFKKGPDYIDPLWLAKASALSKENGCHNLDFNTQTDEEILHTLVQNSVDADISVIEGNKGLYDGVALDGSDSNAAVAKLTKSPVILVIDARGITRGVAPLLMGYQLFDKDVNISGVIFNQSAGVRHQEKLRKVTEEYTDIPVLGIVPKSSKLVLDERHLGLMPSNEHIGAELKINEIADIVSQNVDIDRVIEIAKTADPLSLPVEDKLTINNVGDVDKKADKVRIGICEDSAFGFYYIGDKQALKAAGAELVPINTLEDDELTDVDGLFIGGGFPETHMQQLANNTSMRVSINQAIEAGLPTYAECGGLMYLSQNLHWNGQTSPMVGIIPADAVMHKKPQGRGHVNLVETNDMPWPANSDDNGIEENENEVIKAHEFHYSRLENHTKDFTKHGKFAYKVTRGTGITGEYDGWVYKNLLASYAHMRDTKNYHWASRFVEFVRKSKANTNKSQ